MGSKQANRRSRRESGQAGVESALVLPITLFMILGTMQLFMMTHARVMTEYAAYRATR
ncbi:MAG TPA: TadE family protein, partial [Myxococcaceae bacterium]|nr:TadE family protein [Myxococcaceae bacterium]